MHVIGTKEYHKWAKAGQDNAQNSQALEALQDIASFYDIRSIREMEDFLASMEWSIGEWHESDGEEC